MKATVEIFSSITCPHCHGAIKIVEEVKKERNDIEIIKHIINEEEGFERAKLFEITSVPTLIIKSPISEYIGIRGLFSKKGLNKAIDVSLGKDQF